jgi:hypothetical protein
MKNGSFNVNFLSNDVVIKLRRKIHSKTFLKKIVWFFHLDPTVWLI